MTQLINANSDLLVQWLWPKLIQQELDALRHRFNNHPSGMLPNVAMALHAEHGGQNCLQAVPQEAVRALMDQLGGEELLQFADRVYASKVQAVYDSLDIGELTLTNIWYIFQAMLPHM
ncbi:hypothetical protein M422DRAFT_246038 [Sphaerobolus stellatus SS14]|nr:hypothetical protein M422DRAFT_246038 [Sphaerobolus stellatus SS14]